MSRGIVRTAAARPVFIAFVALVFVAGGCQPAQVRPEPSGPVSSPTTAPVGGPVAFRVQLGAGQTLTMRSPGPDNCPGLNVQVDLGSRRRVRLASYATSCALEGNAQPGNGRHGVYRTTADIPAERRPDAVTVPTALGPATLFNQPYYECTNECKHYTEPVAVVTLDHPTDPAYPALTVYSERGTIGLDQLKTLVRDQLLA